ncbi:MAG: beta-galactosidase [Actinomycetota bacterium]|nr:beta-galactosidase [Actinomycetota bacterium]
MRLNRPLAMITAALIAGAFISQATAAPSPGPAAQNKGQIIPATLFGMQVQNAENGLWPTMPIGSLRLWDNQTSWANIEKSQGVFDWTALDTAVATAKKNGTNDILMVLSGTPAWATDDPSPEALPVPGAAGMPRNLEWWNAWVTAVVTRYKGQITSYQPWNEANLSTFFTGSPQEMADLTKRAYDIIKAIDPAAIVVAPSTGTRLSGAFMKFYPAFLAALGAKGWPIDVWAAHTYPASLGTPVDRAALALAWQKVLKQAKAPVKPMWDTENNFGLKGPGPKNPDVDIDGTKAASWVARTYLDALALNIERVYWYRWEPYNDLWGIQMFTNTPGAKAFETLEDWIVGARFNGCVTEAKGKGKAKGTTCKFVKDGEAFEIVYSTTEKPVTFAVPKGASQMCNLLVGCNPIKGKTIKTAAPVRLNAA